MALTSEILKANAVLTGLTDEQIAAITTLSQNDENTVIGAKIGDIYRQMDTTIATATGVQRNGDEKTYNYLERAAKALKDQAGSVETLNKQVGDLTKEKARLEKVIAEGGADAESKRQLTQATADLKAVQKQYNDLKADHDKAVQTHQTELFGVRIENELSIATAGVKFKAELPKSATDVLLQQATAKIKALNPEYIDDGKGGKMLAFKDETGAIMRNPENQLNPYTAAELVNKELKGMGVIDEGRKAAGAGTGGNGGNGGNGGGGSTVDISGAKTRLEANNMATQALLANGLTIGSAEFDSQMTQIWKDNNVSSLPEK